MLLDEAQPTAFVCASDTLALGVLHTLGDRGIHWGKDIAVVGFDDSQVAQVVPGGLTSVRQPLEQVAVELVKALEGLLSTPPVAGPGVLLTPTLAVRLSRAERGWRAVSPHQREPALLVGAHQEAALPQKPASEVRHQRLTA